MLEHYRVCVALESQELLDTVARELQLHHYDVLTTNTAEGVLEICGTQSPDLLLVESRLGEMTVGELSERLNESAQGARVALVVIEHEEDEPAQLPVNIHRVPFHLLSKTHNIPFLLVRLDRAIRDRRLQAREDEQHDSLVDSIYTDRLTGLRNRRYLLDRLQEEIEKAHRYEYPVACAVLDLDDLEPVDAEIGAASLDDIMVELALTLRDSSRMYDLIARYDGTLFVAVLPHAELENAMGYANKIVSTVGATTYSDMTFPTRAQLRVGLVGWHREKARGADYVLGEAMRALLQAKSLDGKRVIARQLTA